MWSFIEKQVFAMHWLNDLIGRIIESCGGDLAEPFPRSVQFFFFDTIKITILLCTLIFIISWIQSFFPPERTRKIIGRFHGVKANTVAALLGAVTPFCSCSSIPLFIGFTGAGLPMGVTFSFLIASPMVDIGSLMVLSGLIGFKAAVVYICSGVMLAVIGGTIIEKMKLDRYLEDVVVRGSAAMATTICNCQGGCAGSDGKMPAMLRLRLAYKAVIEVLKKVFCFILLGVVIGAALHNYIPRELVESILGGENPFAVITATCAGIPVYADIFGVVPIAEALLAKGVPVGTVVSFMMAVTVLSIPSLIMLRKAVALPLLAIFTGICTLGIIVTGFLFNWAAPWLF